MTSTLLHLYCIIILGLSGLATWPFYMSTLIEELLFLFAIPLCSLARLWDVLTIHAPYPALRFSMLTWTCLLYTSDAADEMD